MDMDYKEGINGEVGNRVGKAKRTDLVMRFLAAVLTLAAAVVLGLSKQTTTVTVKIAPSLPSVNFPVTAKWLDLSAFVYFVVVNAIASFYATISLILTLATNGGKMNMTLMITVLDLLVVTLLFSAIGATGAVGLIGYQGNSHLKWDKVCNVFDKFCNQVAVAMVLCFMGSKAYLLLIVFSTFNVYKKL